MDKKAKRILNRYMRDKFDHRESRVSSGEIAYAKEQRAILEDLDISNEETIRILTQDFKCVSLHDAADAFLYSLSTRDMEYRYILASYVYAASWLTYDRGKTEEISFPVERTFYNWVKYRGGGIWGFIQKPLYYLDEFVHMEKPIPTDNDRNILKEILSIASSMHDQATGVMLRDKIHENKPLPCNKDEIVGILETLAICGILETPEHKGFLDSFTPPLMRDTGDLRQSLSYPLNWWHGENKVNYENCYRIFNIDFSDLSTGTVLIDNKLFTWLC